MNSTVLRIPLAYDFRVISARKSNGARTQRNNFPQAKLDKEINACFVLNEHADLYFYCVIIVNILSSLIEQNETFLSYRKKGESVHKAVILGCKL